MFRICLLIMEWRRGFGQYRLSFRGWITVCIIDKLLFVRDVWLSSSLSSEFMSHCLEYDLLIRRSCDLNRRPLPPLSFTAQPSPRPLPYSIIPPYTVIIDMGVVEGWWVILTLFSGMNCCPDCLSGKFDSAQLYCQSVHDPLPWVLILDPPIQSGSRSAGHRCGTSSERAIRNR